jgi:sulfur relay (sulfurtransferase) complex TusBCD TusD component (DsrE family)
VNSFPTFPPLNKLALTETKLRKENKPEFRVFLMTRSVAANNENSNKSEDNRNQQIKLI